MQAHRPNTFEPLEHLAELLEADTPLPPASRGYLRDALRRWRAGLSLDRAFGLTPGDALRERNDLIRIHAQDLPATTDWHRSRMIADQVRRLHRGHRVEQTWIVRADRIARLPETPRQIWSIIH